MELFLLPFLAGIVPSILLPWVGSYLRLRDEWLATLGLAHLSTAGALLAQFWHWPGFLGSWLLAMLGVAGKQLGGGKSNSAYALMLLTGWSLSLLLAANLALGDALTQAMIDGQLYFSGTAELLVNLGVFLVASVVLRWLGPNLLRERFFPGHARADRKPVWLWLILFDLLAASAIAAATATLGLMASFGLVFVPAWIAFRLAGNWRQTIGLALAVGVLTYVSAFSLALALDQPFGPLLTAVLLLVAFLAAIWGRFAQVKQASVSRLR